MSETAAWRGKSDAWRQGWHDGFNFRAKRLKKSYTPEAKQQYKDGFKTGRDKAEGKEDRISNPRPNTVAEAHAAGAADGRQGLGAVPPRDPKLKDAYMQSYRDNLVARVGVPERRKNNPRMRRNPTPKQKLPGTWQVAQRMVNAENNFLQLVMEKGFSREEAIKIMQTYLKLKVAKLDAVNGVISLKHGAYWESDTLRNALNYKAPAKGRRRANPKPAALVVLYASRPGSRRLKYLGRGKFGERGRPMLFKTGAHARLAAGILRDTHPEALRGWTLKAGT